MIRVRGRETKEQLFLTCIKEFMLTRLLFFHVIIEKFRHSAPFVMMEFMLKKLKMSAVFLFISYLILQLCKHPNENGWVCWLNSSG